MAGGADEMLAKRKTALFAGALHGRVLELGPGIGTNLKRFAAAAAADAASDGGGENPMTSLTLAEPNKFFHADLRGAAAEAGLPSGVAVNVTADSATALPYPDGHFDTVVSTLVLCSVPDPRKAIAEIQRVLAPGGRFLYVEHVHGPPDSWERTIQRGCMASGLWQTFGDGCDLERNTGDWIAERRGWGVVQERFSKGKGPVQSFVVGTATKVDASSASRL